MKEPKSFSFTGDDSLEDFEQFGLGNFPVVVLVDG